MTPWNKFAGNTSTCRCGKSFQVSSLHRDKRFCSDACKRDAALEKGRLRAANEREMRRQEKAWSGK